jgi:hypothetical protein
MAQIYVPVISPFSVTGPLHEAVDTHIQSHHLAYEIAALSHTLADSLTQYESLIEGVTALQSKAKAKPSSALTKKATQAEKQLLNSMLPFEIKQLRVKIKHLNRDLFLMTKKV